MIELIFIFHDLRNTLFGLTVFVLHNINPLLVFILIGTRFNSTSLTLTEITKIVTLKNVESLEETIDTLKCP